MPGQLPTQSLTNGYYLNILTSEYRTTTQFNEWFTVVLNIANDISNCLQFITSAFDLDFAVGVQLDVLGILIGVKRTVPFQPNNGISPVLDDDTYRILLKATIANNQWDGTQGGLYPIWKQLFPGGQIIIIDNQNMTADILMTGSFSSILQDLITNGMIVPRPQAVQYNYVFGTLPFFGFGFNNEFIAGFGTGHWG
jgi:hypothetical protein